jgi:predicted GNAT family N-acyltransferase
MTIRSPQTPEEFSNYYQLRWEILRKPWNQPEGSEKDSMEFESIHLMAIDESGLTVGVCRVQMNDPVTAQVRFMAVRENAQGKGTGKQLMAHAEHRARTEGAQQLVLEARENAVPFYQSVGYRITQKTHLLFGEIQHYRMEKNL